MKKIIQLIFFVPILCFLIAAVSCANDVRVTPDVYNDDGKPFMDFSCEADLEVGDQLSWVIYENEEKMENMRTLALLKETKKAGTKLLYLSYPLSSKDNNHTIVCILEKKNATKVHSKNLSIVFEEGKGREKPETVSELWLWPDKTLILYNDTVPVDLACWAFLNSPTNLPPVPLPRHTTDTKENDAKDTKDKKEKDAKDKKDAEDTKDKKEKDAKDTKDAEDTKDKKEKDAKDTKAAEDTKDKKEKDAKDKKDAEDTKDKKEKDAKDTKDVKVTADDTIYQFVSFYQKRGNTRPTRLIMLPQENNYGYVKLDVLKIFNWIDNGTEIFCRTETMKKDFTSVKVQDSYPITLIYQKPPRLECDLFDGCQTMKMLGWSVALVVAVPLVLALIHLITARYICSNTEDGCGS